MFSIWRNLLPRVRFYYALTENRDPEPVDPNRPPDTNIPTILMWWEFIGLVGVPLFLLSFIGDVVQHHHIHWWYLLVIASWLPFPLILLRDHRRQRQYEEEQKAKGQQAPRRRKRR